MASDPPHSAHGLKSRPFPERLGFALNGIRLVARRERSFRWQLVIGLAAAGVAAALHVDPLWWAVLAVATGLVLALETVNGAVEYLLDCLHPALAEEIGAAKDAAAGAVLIASIAVGLVGALLLAAHLG